MKFYTILWSPDKLPVLVSYIGEMTISKASSYEEMLNTSLEDTDQYVSVDSEVDCRQLFGNEVVDQTKALDLGIQADPLSIAD